jgi:hypothetical protein
MMKQYQPLATGRSTWPTLCDRHAGILCITLGSIMQNLCWVRFYHSPCNVSFIVCAALCAVLCLRVVCYFVWHVHLCVVSYCSTTATG